MVFSFTLINDIILASISKMWLLKMGFGFFSGDRFGELRAGPEIDRSDRIYAEITFPHWHRSIVE